MPWQGCCKVNPAVMRAVGARHFYADTGSGDVRGRMGMFCQRRAYLEMPRPYAPCERALLLSSDNATTLNAVEGVCCGVEGRCWAEWRHECRCGAKAQLQTFQIVGEGGWPTRAIACPANLAENTRRSSGNAGWSTDGEMQ
jgi:hypothetical protein